MSRHRWCGRAQRSRVEEAERRIAEAARAEQSGVALNRTDVDAFLARVRFLVEHHEELLLRSQSLLEKQRLFSLVFDEWPTYAEVSNGTPKLTLAFELSQRSKTEKVDVVHPLGNLTARPFGTALAETVRVSADLPRQEKTPVFSLSRSPPGAQKNTAAFASVFLLCTR